MDNCKLYTKRVIAVLSQCLRLVYFGTFELLAMIEYSGDKIITRPGLFESDVGAGVLQSSIQQTCAVQECGMQKA